MASSRSLALTPGRLWGQLSHACSMGPGLFLSAILKRGKKKSEILNHVGFYAFLFSKIVFWES